MPKKIIQLPEDKQPTLRVKTLPNDANQNGDIFGGWLMSQIDIAAALAAAERAGANISTIAVKNLTFLKPLFIYDVVSFYAKVVKVGITSLTVDVEVFAKRASDHHEIVKVSDATLVYVAISAPGVKRKIS